MTIETRRIRGSEARAIEADGEHYIDLRIITPYVVDDYGSVFMEDTFDASLDQRMPTLCWSHDWSEPIGRGVSWSRKTGEGPVVRFRLDDFDAVPLARRAYAQVQSGTIDDCSVGFSNTDRRTPTDDELKKWPGAREVITQADEDETSLVLRGAVPGAKVLAVRTAAGVVEESLVIDLAKKFTAGELTKEQALAALELAATGQEPPDPDGDDEDEDEGPTEADLLAEADAALDEVLGS